MQNGAARLQLILSLTFRYREYLGRRHRDRLPADHDDLHFRRCHRRPDANAYEMNDVTNEHRAAHARAHGHDAYDDRMYEVNEVDGQDAVVAVG